MGIYDFDARRLALLLIPPVRRTPGVYALARAAVQGVCALYGRFRTWKADAEYRLTHGGQVCHLRAVLNDAFDPELRRIRVEDAEGAGAVVFLYERRLDRPAFVPWRSSGDALMVDARGMGGASGGADFTVRLPAGLARLREDARLKALTDRYRLASKRWRAVADNN